MVLLTGELQTTDSYILPIFYSLYSIPICLYANGVAILPLGVLVIYPICIRYGSYTSSKVSTSSPTVVASVSNPTGLPPIGYYHCF